MNIYEKLNEARSRFREEGFKKGGKNGFANYSYFKLKDILQLTTKICKDLKIFCAVSFGAAEAVMTVIDCEKPDERIEFKSPMSRAALKGCHEVQNLGAVETYIRRYLYMTVFEIEECDPSEDLDSGAVIGESTSEAAEKANAQTPLQNGTQQNGTSKGGANPSSNVPSGNGRKRTAVDEVIDFMNAYHDELKKIPASDGSGSVDDLLYRLVGANDEKTCAMWIPWLKNQLGKKGN
ncbi:MAG: ERF family protein [Treponema sp.]|nr:ERF family protein [Treponema sp.]